MQASLPRRPREHISLRNPLVYPLPSPRVLRWGLLVPACVAMVLGLLWLGVSSPATWQIALMGCAIVLQLFCVWNLPLWDQGTFLRRSGTKWGFATAGQAEEGELRALVVAWDGQRWLLIKVQWATPSAERQRWLLLMRASEPERWPDIRRVLYSSLAVDTA